MLPGSVTESRSLLVHLDYLGQTKVSYILLKDDQLCKYHILTRPTKHWFVQLVNVTHLNTIPLGRWSAPCSHHITLLLGLHLHKQTHLSDYNFRKTHKEKTPLHTVKDQDSLFLGSNYYQKQTVCKKKNTYTWKMFPVWDADWPEMVWASIVIGFGHISPGYALRRSANSS